MQRQTGAKPALLYAPPPWRIPYRRATHNAGSNDLFLWFRFAFALKELFKVVELLCKG